MLEKTQEGDSPNIETYLGCSYLTDYYVIKATVYTRICTCNPCGDTSNFITSLLHELLSTHWFRVLTLGSSRICTCTLVVIPALIRIPTLLRCSGISLCFDPGVKPMTDDIQLFEEQHETVAHPSTGTQMLLNFKQ